MSTLPAGISILHAFRVDSVEAVAWSPDGRFLAISSRRVIRLWDPQTETMLSEPIFAGHSSNVIALSWSPDGKYLASASLDGTARVWNIKAGKSHRMLGEYNRGAITIAWSPDGRYLALSSQHLIRFWDPQTETMLSEPIFAGHSLPVQHLVWSPDSRYLASGSLDYSVRIWDTTRFTAASVLHLQQHSAGIHSVAWSPNGRYLTIGLREGMIRIWDMLQGIEIRRIEGMTAPIRSLTFSFDGRLLAFYSAVSFRNVFIRRTDTWEEVGQLPVGPDNTDTAIFHPSAPMLITPGVTTGDVRLWDLDVNTLFGNVSSTPILQYSSAKVVLLGDSGVGKTGLALKLSGQNFRATESTHGRHIWPFSSELLMLDERRKELRETFLWDLAGQPNYRLIHQLHLDEVAVALVIFDGKAERAPFDGVYHWDRALRQAQSAQGLGVPPVKKILIAARIDRGGIPVNHDRVRKLVAELGFDGYFETSAKEGINISSVVAAIKDVINWQVLPKLSSTDLFQTIKLYLVQEKSSGRVLSPIDDLYRGLIQSGVVSQEVDGLRAQFETCIVLLESRDLIQRLRFGNLVLLQPELVDAYASALINTVGREPDGLGSISEDRVKNCDFDMPEDERLKDRETEKLLLLAMIEDLLRRELALREHTSSGTYLVFPSQTTREAPDLYQPEGQAVAFEFMGAIRNIYATLAVRLSFSDLFRKNELWKDAVSYSSATGGVCGLILTSLQDGLAELTLFFDRDVPHDTKAYFIRYVQQHLTRYAVLGSVQRRHVIRCSRCGAVMDAVHVKRRLELNRKHMQCPVCDESIDLLEQDERLAATALQSKIDGVMRTMDGAADLQRSIETTAIIEEGKAIVNERKIDAKRLAGKFDVLMCHNAKDKQAVKEIAQQLLEEGILPWLDEWEVPPGQPFQELLEQQIGKIGAAAIFVGDNNIGPWQHLEEEAFIREFVKRRVPVIPVFLKDTSATPEDLPVFLRGMHSADFRKETPHPLKQLIWGITRERP